MFVLLKQGYNTAFLKGNDELQKINEWFISNKLSFNVKKNFFKKYSFFHKPSEKYDIPLVLPKLNTNNRKTNIKYIENKISKNKQGHSKIKSHYYHFTTRIFS